MKQQGKSELSTSAKYEHSTVTKPNSYELQHTLCPRFAKFVT
jgi:hypothetical protein